MDANARFKLSEREKERRLQLVRAKLTTKAENKEPRWMKALKITVITLWVLLAIFVAYLVKTYG